MGYQHVEIERQGHIATLWLNRPEKRNALSSDMWEDIPAAMAELDADDSVRVVVLAGRGPAFTVGIDIELLASMQPAGESAASSNMRLYRLIRRMQETATCLSDSPKPVIAVVHGYCLGAGMDLITACDIRLASEDAIFSIRETRMGLVADVGTLQRLPGIVGAGHTAELAMTGRDIDAVRAMAIGLVNAVHPDPDSTIGAAKEVATEIAGNSPLVVRGIKTVLAANDGRTVEQALDFVAQWNASYLMSNDLMEAVAAFMEKRRPDFTGT
ncbi:MAG TPA: crotonase/enoyl-CoA hydratase family protein [Acidimicrobiia bacterium]|nr:crotonase/enoyl-CoA hydratase family protein [Acidimicrobiia bacterium]